MLEYHAPLLDSRDGLIATGDPIDQLHIQFARLSWQLDNEAANPGHSECRSRFERLIEKGLPDITQAEHIPGAWHLGISSHMHSYYHLLCDLLPFLLTAPKRPVLIPDYMPQPFVELLQNEGYELRVLPPGLWQIDRLSFPDGKAMDWPREKVLLLQNWFDRRFPRQPTSHARRIYISREQAVKRHLVNEAEFLPLLEQHGFETVHLEDLTIANQVAMMRQASHIFAPHGAGLVHALVAPASVRILEARSERLSGKGCFERLFAACGIEYHDILVPKKEPRFRMPLERLEPALKNLLQID